MLKKREKPIYRFDLAVNGLDEFAKRAPARMYGRAWRRLKSTVAALAYTDYYSEGVSLKQALAWSWEDAHMSFLGVGDPILNAAVMNLWLYVGPAEREDLAKSIAASFKEAEDKTDTTVVRRYLKDLRTKPVRKPEEGWRDSQVLPIFGPAFTDWTVDGGRSVFTAEAQMLLCEENERKALAADRARAAALAEAKALSAEAEPLKVTATVMPKPAKKAVVKAPAKK